MPLSQDFRGFGCHCSTIRSVANSQGKCQFMKELTLNQKELARLQVLNNVLEHRLPMDQAAEPMGVTERHAWRILAAYRKE